MARADYFGLLTLDPEHMIHQPLSLWMSTSPYMALNLSLGLQPNSGERLSQMSGLSLPSGGCVESGLNHKMKPQTTFA